MGNLSNVNEANVADQDRPILFTIRFHEIFRESAPEANEPLSRGIWVSFKSLSFHMPSLASAGRPTHMPTAHHMQVKMKDGLATILASIGNNSIPRPC